jgi:hypothetical protein
VSPNDTPPSTPGQQREANSAPGGASCGVRSPYPEPAPNGAGASRSAAGPGVPVAEREDGPGVPSGEEQPAPSAAVSAAPRRRLRQSTLRPHRICPRFSEAERTAVQHAARAADLAPGGYAAAATLAAATSINPTAAVADYRRGVQELMESNRQLAAVGNNLNQVAHFLNAGGQPATDLRQLLHRIDTALAGVDDAVGWLVRR